MAGMEMAGAANQPVEILSDWVVIEAAFAWGSYGTIYNGRMIEEVGNNPIRVVFKKLKASDTADADFTKEVAVMSTLDHRNILRLLGVTSDKESSRYMIFNYMVKGSLDCWLQEVGPIFSEPTDKKKIYQLSLIDIGLQIADGMAYLEGKEIVHRDLAARNILLAEDLRCRIADFGLSKNIGELGYYTMGSASVYPIRWTAPETLQTRNVNSKSDVWSFGVLLWEIFSYGKVPFESLETDQIKKYVADGNKLQEPDGCPEEVYELMLQCWQRDPGKRPSFQIIFDNIYDIIQKMLLFPFLNDFINWDKDSREYLPRQDIWNITDLSADIREKWGLENWPIPLCNFLGKINKQKQPQGGPILQLF